jgi:hypothetical protein
MKEYETYFLCDVKQGSADWKFIKRGRISGSNIGLVVERPFYCKKTDEELARYIMGLDVEEHTPEAKARMSAGNDYEPLVREHLSKYLGKKIRETGYAIYKRDPKRFGVSLDGVVDKDTCIEIKCPANMYIPILNYMKKENPDPDDYSHIYSSHYLQMLIGMAITNRKSCVYAVYGIKDETFFVQVVKFDEELWEKIYLKACIFHDKYIKPLMD